MGGLQPPAEETPPLAPNQTPAETLGAPPPSFVLGSLPNADPQDNAPSPSAPTLITPDITHSKLEAESTRQPGPVVFQGVEFHHASEAEFARLLTYYGIEWQYEPHQFPLQWRDGRPVEMFSPDFYLTEYDLYIELTTMRQALVRRKNRKLRLLRALYPEIHIKLLYRRDYQRLLERFGIAPDVMEAEQPPNNGTTESEEAEETSS